MNLHNVTSTVTNTVNSYVSGQSRQLLSPKASFVGTAAKLQPAAIPADAGYYQDVADTGLHSVMTTLYQLQQQSAQSKGWILVLGPTHCLSKQLLEKFQIETNRVLLINAKQIHRYDNLMRDALTCATCEAVLSFLPQDHLALSDYQYLANKYQTKLFNHSVQMRSQYVM